MAISIFNRKKQFFAPEVEGLIKQLTGFEESDRNYQEVERFIYSNIIHHNYATVDTTVVKNTIDNYIEKFKAHGLNDRAKRLKELVEKYVTSDSSQHTRWLVLWLLLNLSTRPTAVPDEDLEGDGSPEFIKQEEDINWADYLREGQEEFLLPEDNSEDESEWLSVSEKDDTQGQNTECLEVPAVEELRSYGSVPHPTLWQTMPPRLSHHEALRHVIRDARRAEQWLMDHVQHSWWADATRRSLPHSARPEARVCQIWEERQLGWDVVGSRLTMLSEFKVLYEVLWMLQVPTDSGVFYRDEQGQFQVKQTVSLPSTIPETFRLHLTEFCPYINTVNKLKRFEDILNKCETCGAPPPVTYKAYCAALFRQLQKFTNVVISIENRLNRQEETMTLVSVLDELSAELKVLRFLDCIQDKAIVDWTVHPAWFCATRLLSVLYEIVCGASDEKLLEVSLDIFIHSFHPYLDIIDIWLSEGRLEDWRREFLVIKENGGMPQVMPYEAEMRKSGVTPVTLLTRLVAVVREAGSTMEIVNSLNKLSQFRDTVRNKGCLFKEFSDNVLSEIKRLKEKIAESSVLMKQNISESTDRVKDKNDNALRENQTESVECDKETNDGLTPKSSYATVNSSVDNLVDGEKEQSLLSIIDESEPQKSEPEPETPSLTPKSSKASKSGVTTPIPTPTPSLTTPVSGGPTPSQSGSGLPPLPPHLLSLSSHAMYEQTMTLLLQNLLLGEVFRGYATPSGHTTQTLGSAAAENRPSTDYSVSLVGLMSIHSVLERQLSLVETRHRSAMRLVTDTLLREHCLRDHFTVLRTVYFMENGNLAQSFYCYLFKEIEAGTWNNLISLNAQLKVCVEEFFPGFEYQFTVQVKPLTGEVASSRSVHEVIPAITLAYRVDWPISLVISEASIESYNKVFRFLLHLKYAFWTLRNTRFSDLAKSRHVLWVRRLHVLKTWMLHSTNTLHSYFMGLVLRSYSTHLEESVRSADSLQVIVEAHNKFVNEVMIHCLQDKKNYLESFIKKLLKLCSSLAELWETEARGGGDCLEAELCVLEEAFVSAYHGLIHCLEMVSPEEDVGNYLYELKCEIASSEPEYFSGDTNVQTHPK